MDLPTTIRILAPEPNKRGDLFGRMMSDLLLTLGYDRFRLNIHKSGREIDIEAFHRTEPNRRIIAECKATEAPVGGADINKFVGVLDAERRTHPDFTTTGYFISLSGFAETAIEQERTLGNSRVVQVDSNTLVSQLTDGHVVVTGERAVERAGRSAAELSNLKLDSSCELLVHDLGWIWAIFFTEHRKRTAFSLIHADGESLDQSLAQEIIDADRSVGGNLHELVYLAPGKQTIIPLDELTKVKEKYFAYIQTDYGKITLEGLPADQLVGSRQLDLENIFVPLHLERAALQANGEESASPEMPPDFVKQPSQREPVGKILATNSRLAILAAPGGGKSTLLKRLAVAYAFPERLTHLDDMLPRREWFPLIVRCRQLNELASEPMNKILNSIPTRAEMAEATSAFEYLVSEALRNGNALLLIDGLDELSDEGERIAFVKQLRTFLATYPTASIVVTSREAGFRIVGGALSALCEHYKIADLDEADIHRLTLAWHAEVVGSNAQVTSEATKLAKAIWATDRVRRLAQNPLLLTTLLLVKRWVGEVPRKRTILYQKAIEVLLMTWNVEGHEPIDQEEALPQLAFIAYTMMTEGIQTISVRRLSQLIQQAREQMPEVLGFARTSVSKFVQRVEERSSVLSLSGHAIEDGRLTPIYEFKHLTFQEYLTAVAVVDGYYQDRREDDTVESLLRPHLGKEDWREVIPLAAVLAGRRAAPLVQSIIDVVRASPSQQTRRRRSNAEIVHSILVQCLIDEVQLSPPMAAAAAEWAGRRSRVGITKNDVEEILNGKYGQIFRSILEGKYFALKTDYLSMGGLLSEIALLDLKYELAAVEADPFAIDLKPIVAKLKGTAPLENAYGALALMWVAYASRDVKISKQKSNSSNSKRGGRRRKTKGSEEGLYYASNALLPLLESSSPPLQTSACWALAWIASGRFWSPVNERTVVSRLFRLWRTGRAADTRYTAAWAFAALPLLQRDSRPLGSASPSSGAQRRHAACVAAYYLGSPWNDRELADRAGQLVETPAWVLLARNIRELLTNLGEPGREVLERVQKTQPMKQVGSSI